MLLDISTCCWRIDFCAAHKNFFEQIDGKEIRSFIQNGSSNYFLLALTQRRNFNNSSFLPATSFFNPSCLPFCFVKITRGSAQIEYHLPFQSFPFSPFSFFIPSLSRVDCIRLCAVSSTFFACSPTVIG